MYRLIDEQRPGNAIHTAGSDHQTCSSPPYTLSVEYHDQLSRIEDQCPHHYTTQTMAQNLALGYVGIGIGNGSQTYDQMQMEGAGPLYHQFFVCRQHQQQSLVPYLQAAT
jgi:hypothetical protein